LLLTGLSTFAVGFVRGYAEIGIWGAVILTVLRLIQGIGVGGEWGGAVCRSAPSPALSPRAGRGLEPRSGRVRGSGRRIWADLPRRTTKPDSRAALARMAEQAPFDIFTAFVFTYGMPERTNRDISKEPAYGAAAERNLKIGAGPCGGAGSGLYTGSAIISIIKWLCRAC
jgi:hypothetical protein